MTHRDTVMFLYHPALSRKLYLGTVLAVLSGFILWLHPAAGQEYNTSTVSLMISPNGQNTVGERGSGQLEPVVVDPAKTSGAFPGLASPSISPCQPQAGPLPAGCSSLPPKTPGRRRFSKNRKALGSRNRCPASLKSPMGSKMLQKALSRV